MSKEYLKNAIAATNEPRYPNVIYNSCTNVKNTYSNKIKSHSTETAMSIEELEKALNV